MLRRILAKSLVFATLCLGTANAIVSFPGAIGFGNAATGGRGGTVYHVTTLADAGTGSFRDAVSSANRIVVFDVSGWITLTTAVSIKSNITIAGQTAPGSGIGFRGGELSCAGQSNIIMRYIRIVPGSETASTTDDALSLYNAHNVILDHCSFEFAPWNNIDGVSDDWQNTPVTDITFQYNLIADPTGQQFGAHCESVSSNWAFYYNAFVTSHNRNPLAKVNDVFVNNINYNYEAAYTTHTSTNFSHDVINNYFIFGPASTGTDNTWYQVDKNQTMYYSGNMKDKTLDGVLNGSETTPYWYQGEGTILTAPWSTVTTSNPIYTAASAFRIVTSLSGTLPYNQLDSLIWGQVNKLGAGTEGQGAGTPGPATLYTTQVQTGLGNNGYGNIVTGTKATDTDGDGMPDFWEAATSSNLNSNDAMTLASDGYALIEKYINWLGAIHSRVLKNSYVDIDMLAFTQGFKSVSPTYTVASGVNGTMSVLADGHTVRFTPTANYTGQASFSFTVKGSDATTFTSSVSVLVEPSAISLNPIKYIYELDSANADKAWTNVNNWTPVSLPSAIDTAVIRTGEVQVSQDIPTITMVETNGIFRITAAAVNATDLRLQGGTLKSYTSTPLYALTSTITVQAASTIMAGSLAASVFELDATLKGSAGLTKNSVGVLLLNKTSANYTGTWTVSEGIVRLGAKNAMGSGAVTVNAGADLSLNTAGGLRGASSLTLLTDGTKYASLELNSIDTVERLYIGTTGVSAGTYTASSYPLYMTGTGSLTVLTGSATNTLMRAQNQSGYNMSVLSKTFSSNCEVQYQIPHAGAKLLMITLEGKILAEKQLPSANGSVNFSEIKSIPTGNYYLAIEWDHSIRATTLVQKQ